MDNHVHQAAGAREPGLGAIVLRRGLDRFVNPRARLAPRDAQQPAIVQALEQVRAGIEVAAPPLDAAMVEVCLQVPRMGATTLAHKRQHLAGGRLHTALPRARHPGWTE